MEGNLQLLYVLLTDCYVYLLRKGACRPRAGPGHMEDETDCFLIPCTCHSPPKPSRLPPLYPPPRCPRVSLCCTW